MSTIQTIHMAQRGLVTLPRGVRETYALQPGDALTLVDLGGALMLVPGRSEVQALADRVADGLVERGETLESMLQALREERDAAG